MSAQDAKTVIDILAGNANLTNARIIEAVKDYLQIPDDDVSNTNNELGSLFLAKLKEHVLTEIRTGASVKYQAENQAGLAAAIGDAEQDIG